VSSSGTTQGKERGNGRKTTQKHIHELQTQRVQLHPLCALPSRALPGPLLASVVGLLRVRRWWCPLLGQRHSVSAVEPVNKNTKACVATHNVSLAFPRCDKRQSSDLSNEGGLLGRDPRLCGVITNFLSELSGRGFGLDHGGGCFVAATWE
jgi:hypothetical protein